MRSKSAEFVRSVMAEGREFYGQGAADASLINSVTTYDDLVSRITAKFVDGGINSTYTAAKQSSGLRGELNEGAQMARKTLTEQEIAAIAAGAPLLAEGDAKTEASAADGEGSDLDVKAGGATEPPKDEKPEQADKAFDAAAALLKVTTDQLTAANSDLLATKLELSKAHDKLAEMTAVIEPLKAIAARSLNNMRIALGNSALDLSAMSAAQLLADHDATQANFTTKMRVGGVSAANAETSAGEKAEFKMDSKLAAKINAVRGN
jgi:hypothetical protein